MISSSSNRKKRKIQDISSSLSNIKNGSTKSAFTPWKTYNIIKRNYIKFYSTNKKKS